MNTVCIEETRRGDQIPLGLELEVVVATENQTQVLCESFRTSMPSLQPWRDVFLNSQWLGAPASANSLVL